MVGDGKCLLVWSSSWLVDGDRMCIPLIKNILVDLNLRISDLLLDNFHHWNLILLNDLLYPQNM